jgi:plasmid stabilization system protein ParE
VTSYSVSIDPDALVDIEKATRWYDNHSPALGEKFQKQVTNDILSLRDNPQLYAVRYGNVRCMALSGFPYQILFTVTNSRKQVRILNILHKNTSPNRYPRS